MAFGDGVMGMQAFRMDDPYGEPARLWITLQGAVQPAHRVSQNIRFCPLARAKACSSARFTAVCTAVPRALSPRSASSSRGSPMQSSARPMRRCALLRWLCGVATMPALLPSQASTLA